MAKSAGKSPLCNIYLGSPSCVGCSGPWSLFWIWTTRSWLLLSVDGLELGNWVRNIA